MEGAAAVVGIITAAGQSFSACVQAFEFFNTAQHIGPDGDLFRTGLEFEKYRLISWACRVGIDRDSRRSALNWEVAKLLLNQLELFLTSADRLKTRYALEVSEEQVQEIEKLRALEPPKQGIGKLIARLKPNIYNTSAQIIQANNSPIKRLLWATRDKEKLKKIINEIAGLIDKLEHLLDDAERLSERAEYTKLLREVISLTSTTSEARQIEELVRNVHQENTDDMAIEAAAYVKQIRLVVGMDKREDEVKPTTPQETLGLSIKPLNVLKRSLTSWKGEGESLRYLGLEFASYNQRQVLIQWKTVDSLHWDIYKGQMKSLALLLASFRDDSFHSLPCKGYYPMRSRAIHGIVYEMPDNDTDWTFKTLKDLISEQPHVSLGRRTEIARMIAQTVLQLHTAGWMHKSLRPENIIFLAPRGSSNILFLKSEPIIVGYDYARADNEHSAAAYTQRPDTDVDADLYRHLKTRGDNRETYQKRFDLYSLGCLILELACWRILQSIFSTFVTEGLADTIEDARKHNSVLDLPTMDDILKNEEAVAYIEHNGGTKIREIISLCCSIPKAGEDEEGLLKEQVAVVRELEWCRM
ncbi:hypothetical protein CGLO_05163 [Colletotrichum gloeosporioides Cg-14]|uniref:Protein kinase domain-containing protein n=1 Tax=Colletotrichum gloeosporioides (strain Cg-14) TaxID=1237896 RepID=T0KSA0_COLGC|nr:hypothetical protein CGLO_05163 [Colletotrichum gloeosporioides Cg-14]